MAERIGLGIPGFGIMGERLARFAAQHDQVRRGSRPRRPACRCWTAPRR